MGVNIRNEKLVKIFNIILKMREIILFLLIVVINMLVRIDSDIELDTCTERRWKEEVSKTKMDGKFVRPKERQVRESLHRLQNLANQGLESP